jgi:transposase
MQTVSTIGLDIAKSVFQVHGVDANGQVVIRRQLKRRYVLAFFEKLPPCLGMRPNRRLAEWDKWCLARKRITNELNEYYRAYTTRELPPQFSRATKKARSRTTEEARQIARLPQGHFTQPWFARLACSG